MNDDEIWELARKPVTEFMEAIKEMNLNVDKLVKFYLKHTRNELDAQVNPKSGADTEVPMDEDSTSQQVLSPLGCAKLQLAIVFAINTCYWMYLVTDGEDPKKSEISKDIERIRLFMKRAKEVEDSFDESCSAAKRPKVVHAQEAQEW